MVRGGPDQLTAPLSRIVWVFAWFGSTVFGGGSATIAVLDRQIADRHQWLDRRHTQLAYALSRLTPGTNLLAFCTGAGWLIRGAPGAAVALLAASIPCSVIAVALTMLYRSWANHALARLALQGALASAVAIMIATCWTIVRPQWRAPHRGRVALTFLAAFALATWGVSPVRVLAASAIVGAIWPEREDA